jgi:hypothetical protein
MILAVPVEKMNRRARQVLSMFSLLPSTELFLLIR